MPGGGLTGVRGMDAIVVATAREFGSTLVTLDAEMQQRVDGAEGGASVTG
ncbi:MAG: hypothetical protein M3442_10280 [Chloroflexota bacterium]|nr:hypothetical protein [Chloroflexota bacterium]